MFALRVGIGVFDGEEDTVLWLGVVTTAVVAMGDDGTVVPAAGHALQ